jgi:Fur family peroxide stress response transcriptional regulator
MNIRDYQDKLSGKGLKITPQRMAVLEAFDNLRSHPTAEKVTEFIRRRYPNIAIGTVYKILETFVKHGILNKVKTDQDVMRYDPVQVHHHHLYCHDSDRIEDYYDDELNEMIAEYFSRKPIKGFIVGEIKLQINGKFNNRNK